MQETYTLEKAKPEAILEKASAAVVERAKSIDARIEEIIHSAKSEFIECGLLIAEMEDSALWVYLTNPQTGEQYANIGEWVGVRLGYGRATYMEAKRVVKEFPNIPVDTLKEIPRVNFKHLRLLPESKQKQEKWIEAAKGPEKEFVDKVVKELPDLHVEKKTKLIFTLPASAEKPIMEAIETMMGILKKDDPNCTKEDALEHICTEWLEHV